MRSSPQTGSVLAFANQRGTVAITSVLLVLGLTGMAALTIDIGHALLTQNQLQNAADATALAAGSELGDIYFHLPRDQQQDLTRNITDIEQAAIETLATTTAFANGASNVANLSLNTAVLGVWSWSAGAGTPGTFNPTVTRPNAVQVTVSRNGQSNGPISTFFGGIFGVNTMNLNTVSTAALGVIGGNLPPGEAEPPLGISSKWPTATGCGNFISMRPNDQVVSCAGWHNFEKPDVTPPTVATTIDDIMSGDFESPEIIPYVTEFNFTNGNMNPVYKDFKTLFDDRRGNNSYWDTTVPVYQDLSAGSDCDNPIGMTKIVAFANVRISNVSGAPDHKVDVQVQCDTFTTGKPSGPQPPPNAGGGTIPISRFAVIVQ